MDAAQWPQGIGMEPSRAISERRPRPDKDKQALDCPRCSSTNTKFCYYNNYSLSQPRYFCKTCRRYWTEGGSLRNVPVGGGSRKNKRSSTSTSSSSSPSQFSSKRQPPHDLTTPNGFSQSTHQNPRTHDGQDLNLAYPPSTCNYLYTPSSSSHQIPSMELFKSGNIASIYNSSGFPVQEFKPSLNNHFSVDGYGNFQGVQEGSSGAARLFFPFENLKLQATTSSGTTADFDHHQQNIRGEGDQASGYWSGMLGGGGGSWLA